MRLSGFAAEQGSAAAVFVQAVEQRPGQLKDAFVGAGHGQAAQRDVEPGRLGGVVTLVIQVGLVDDLGDLPRECQRFRAGGGRKQCFRRPQWVAVTVGRSR